MNKIYDDAYDLYLDENDDAAINLIESTDWTNSLELLVLYGQIILNPSGRISKRSIKKGVNSLIKALEMGSMDAAEELGSLYFYSDELVKQNISKALDYWNRGYNLGSVHCANELLNYYKDYDELNFNKIIEFATFLTKDDVLNKTGYFNLGKVHLNQAFEGRDSDLAVQYFDKACSLGSEIACMKIMEIYYYGNNNLSKDLIKSLKYCEKASKSTEHSLFREEIDFWKKKIEKELAV